MKLGVDTFSLRFNDWDAYEHLAYAARIGVDVVHFSELNPGQSDTGQLRELKQEADRLGVQIEVGMKSICPTSTTFDPSGGSAADRLARMIEIAALVGSPAVRCFLGSNADRRTAIAFADHMAATVATCQAVRGLALDSGVKIAIENHAGDMQGRELARLVEQAGPDYVGACIDAGNPLWVAESPFVALEHLAPYVVMSHVRDTSICPHPQGATAQWVAMGDGTVDIAAWSRLYQQLCPNTNFTLEIITTLPAKVLNYLEADFWNVYPDTPAHEFARFLNHVQAGRPYTEPVLTANWGDLSPEYRAALALEQQRQLEKSVRYCREVLSI